MNTIAQFWRRMYTSVMKRSQHQSYPINMQGKREHSSFATKDIRQRYHDIGRSHHFNVPPPHVDRNILFANSAQYCFGKKTRRVDAAPLFNTNPYYGNALTHRVMEYNEIHGVLERNISKHTQESTKLNTIYQACAHQEYQEDDILGVLSQVNKELDSLNMMLLQRFSKNAPYPFKEDSQQLSFVAYSEISEYLCTSNERYKDVLHNHSAIREDATVRACNAFLEKFNGYSYAQYGVLYIVLSLLKERGVKIPIELLALLELNITNQKAIEVVSIRRDAHHIYQKKKAFLEKLAKVKYIPSHKRSRMAVKSFMRMQNLFSRSCSQQSPKRRFEYIPWAQCYVIPHQLHFSLDGICMYLSMSYLYFLSVYGVAEGKNKFMEVMQHLSTLDIYNNKQAKEKIRGLNIFNIECHVHSDTPLVKDEHLLKSSYGEYNRENRLQLEEVAEILFHPESCAGREYLFLRQISPTGGYHGTSVFREFVKDNKTGNVKVVLHYYNPNYGIVTTDNIKLFMHTLSCMERKDIGFSIHQVNERAIEGYKNRFGNYSIDVLEDRVHNNSNFIAKTMKNQDEDCMAMRDAILYNYHQGTTYNILPSLLSLCRTWEGVESVVQRKGGVVQDIYLQHGGEKITPEVLYQIHDSLNLQKEANFRPENTLLAIDLYKCSEEKNTLYAFLLDIIAALEKKWNMDMIQYESDVEIKEAKSKMLFSINKLKTFMFATGAEDEEL